ncbi:hypothetical protein SY86_00985 [Erwinia tracheiphila]|uniref:Uncharacterized protein n=1 Tax=Erwinia tracheiphila TaxID=65700 RepID=A0A0M2KM96_9GAMM|nr:hypothetical protein SY86_00985 [Erwinia tracheiphila]
MENENSNKPVKNKSAEAGTVKKNLQANFIEPKKALPGRQDRLLRTETGIRGRLRVLRHFSTLH